MADSVFGTCGTAVQAKGPMRWHAVRTATRGVAWAAMLLCGTAWLGAAEGQPLDIQRAKQLYERVQKGEKLSPEDQAYLDRVRQEVQRRQQQGGEKSQPGQPAKKGRNMGPVPPATSSTGLIPLTDLGTNKYKGEDGGLYGGGSNEPPAAHRAAVEKQLKSIQPRDADGKPARDGKIVLLSVGMSNTTMEFQVFKRKADADPLKSPQVVIVDGAQGARVASVWARGPEGMPSEIKTSKEAAQKVDPWPVVDQRLKDAGISPEPYAYEGAFAMRWVIQKQIKGDSQLNFDSEKGTVMAPAVLWGPYLWTDGVKPRQGDKLVWMEDDVVSSDRTHPSDSGREKVANLLLDFFHNNPLASCWYLGASK